MTLLLGYTDAGEQAWMVLDQVRLHAFKAAIEEVVRPGDVVLDVGSGNGLLSLLAAKVGAAKVYAVERSGAIELTVEHARENGFAEVIDARRADIFELSPEDFDPRPDVVVSEMLGHFAPDEDLHAVMRQAMRLAKPGARCIPASYEVWMAPANPRGFCADLDSLADVGGVTMQALAGRLLNRPLLSRVEPEALVGPGVVAGAHEVLDATPERFDASLVVEQAGPVAGVVAWFRSQLSPNVTLDTAPTAERTHWQPAFFPIDPPLDCTAGDELEVELRPRLISRRGTWAWRVACRDQVRRGDAMKALVGTKEDTLADLGIKAPGTAAVQETPRLSAWAAMLGGEATHSVDVMSERLRAAMPERYGDEDTARQEAKRLLAATGALR